VKSDPYSRPSDPAKRQSAALTDGPDRAPARAMLKGTGFTDEDLARPLVGVATSWIETMRAARRSSSTPSPSRTECRWGPKGCARRSSLAR
jgi:dihydroxyacid dehydratase/phosphogluconate dehydratase